jgi:hypothetical protein
MRFFVTYENSKVIELLLRILEINERRITLRFDP